MKRELQIGDQVKIKGLNITGIVASIDHSSAHVESTAIDGSKDRSIYALSEIEHTDEGVLIAVDEAHEVLEGEEPAKEKPKETEKTEVPATAPTISNEQSDISEPAEQPSEAVPDAVVESSVEEVAV
jgi:hypothetical protein